jgi:hypothetical protein
MEFTGNIIGYASSVVSKMYLCPTRQLTYLITVVGLLLLLYRLGPFMACPTVHSVCHWCDSRSRLVGPSREPSVGAELIRLH